MAQARANDGFNSVWFGINCALADGGGVCASCVAVNGRQYDARNAQSNQLAILATHTHTATICSDVLVLRVVNLIYSLVFPIIKQ